MTFSLRRKRRTTPPASPWTAPTSAKSAALALGCLLAAGSVGIAQDATSPYTSVITRQPAPLAPALQGVPVRPLDRPAPPPETGVIRRVAMQAQVQPQQPGMGGLEARTYDTEALAPQIQLTPPGPERLFRLENQAALMERWRQEALERVPPERIVFPEEPKLTSAPWTPRQLPPLKEVVEPHYVAHGRLYFEQKNFERFGWDLGFVTPFVSAGVFFWDALVLPYNMGTEPLRCWDTSAGKCLPGDEQSPLLLYPIEFSLTGAIAEAGAVLGAAAVFAAP